MIIKLNQETHFTIDDKNGCKIKELTLKGKTIIKSIQGQDFLGSGSYLMFPWVNRVVQNPYTKLIEHKFSDGKKYPLHGLFMNTERKVNVQKIEENQKVYKIIVTIQNAEKNLGIHNFIETFILTENSLVINFKAIPSQSDSNPFCFGYHPYLELSKPISQLKISTNLSYQLQLQQDLLSKWPQEKVQRKQEILIDAKKKYDSLFKGQQNQNYVQLDDGQNKLRISSDLKCWQIYTPQDGKRIAVQPMSFQGNLYQAVKQSPQIKQILPNQGHIKITIN